MLFTVTTVLDTKDNIDFFVRSNLAMGVDHMVIFLDAPGAEGQREVHDWLAATPHVTVVPTGKTWWAGDRPRSLNMRQRINANLVVSALADQPWASWVFHLDGDEVFAGDRGALDALPSESNAVWLAPLEAVSDFEPVGRPTLFKPLLDEDDLTLLQVLGVLQTPTNADYFHGHVLGKSGVRPSSGLRLTLHEAVDAQGAPAQRVEEPGLSVLHYDAISGVEFVRKWTAMLGAGPARFRSNRASVAQGLRALVGKDLEPEIAQRYLRRIYEISTQDDITTLDELGLLIAVDTAQGTHAPASMSPDQLALVEGRINALAGKPKRHFNAQKAEGQPGGGPGEARRSRLTQAVGRLRRED